MRRPPAGKLRRVRIVTHTPPAPGIEAQHDQVPVGTQDTVDFAQDVVRIIGSLKGMRQEHGIDGIRGDGQVLGSTDQVHTRSRPVRNHRVTPRPGKLPEQLPVAPGTDLQKLVAKNTLEGTGHLVRLLPEQGDTGT